MFKSKLQKTIINIIKAYQKTISPDHGILKDRHPYGYCRFYPSCSEYSKRAIEKHGIIKGIIKSLYRVIRCNPWNGGGVDDIK
jgi:uncharacterized protein